MFIPPCLVSCRLSLYAKQRLDAAVEQAWIDAGFHCVEHRVHDVDQRVGRRDRAIDAPVRERVENRDMTVDGARKVGLAGHVAMMEEADAAVDGMQRPQRMGEER